MKTLKTLKREMLADAATKAAYDAQAEEFAIAHELIAARARAGLSQSEVAQRMGTTQSVVARLESGKWRNGATVWPSAFLPKSRAASASRKATALKHA